jgi:hypothetical protein
MAQQEYPTINGIEPSWADIAVTFTVVGGPLIQMSDMSALKWSRKVDVGERRGTSGGRVMARTSGSGSQDASVTLYRGGLRRLIRALMTKAPTRGNQVLIGKVGFDILVQHTPPGETDIFTSKIKGCRYLGDSDDMKEGPDADLIEVTLNPIEIANIIDGKEVVLI